MRRIPHRRSSLRYALLAVIGLLVGAAAGALTARAHAGPAARSSGAGNWIAAVRLPVPSPGDVSYAVARVRIGSGARLSSPTGLAGQQSIFASHVGGLAIRASSSSWRGLRANTHVYVVVSMVPGGNRSLRDVGFFILRRKAGGGPASANVAFTIANARAQVGSFWVHRVDQRGYASVFAVRNILSTAVANWSRYIRVLQLAHAMAAAAHPLILGAAPTPSSAAARARVPGPWTGGERPDSRVIAVYHLVFGALANQYSYAALKKDPAMADFIATELRNPSLAARWRAVVAQVPLKVPDTYAAAAQEESRFAHVVAPKIGHLLVADKSVRNSSFVALADLYGSQPPIASRLTVHFIGPGRGVVVEQLEDGNPSDTPITCADDGSCSQVFYSYGVAPVRLTATPSAGSTFSGFSGCVDFSSYCEVWVPSWGATVTVNFGQTVPGKPAQYPLLVVTHSLEAGQSGTVTQVAPASPVKIDCPDFLCQLYFDFNTPVTLRANPSTGSLFDHWSGCTNVASNGDCNVLMDGAKTVQAYFGYP